MLIKYYCFVFVLLLSPALANVQDTCVCSDICKDNEKELLGQGTWRLLHGIVENVKRTTETEMLFKNLVLSLQQLYPCAECRKHLQHMSLADIEMTSSWTCSFHNEVNQRLNKTLHDCKTLI